MLRPCHILMLLMATASFAQDNGDLLFLPEDEINLTLRQTPMPELKQDRIGKILTRYYNEGLGGREQWDKVESLNLAGKLRMESGEFQINAYQKKSDMMKMTIRHLENSRQIVLAYDGKVAWQQKGREAKPEPMNEAEARRFIHSSHFGNHLLYPFKEGKTIRYLDTVPIEGTICHQIRVTLDTKYQIDYFIDIRNYLEVKVENTDLKNGAQNSLVFKEYIHEFGVPIAKLVDNYEEGEWVSTLLLEDIKINSGIMPWMFHMPE